MNPEATCLVYILQLDSVTAVSKSPAELWGSYLQAPWAASQNTEMFLCSSYYRWLGAVWVMFSVLCRTCAFHWQHKKQHERCDPFAFEISIRSRCMPDMLSRLQVLWGRNCWDASVLCLMSGEFTINLHECTVHLPILNDSVLSWAVSLMAHIGTIWPILCLVYPHSEGLHGF